jgi:hypothetical protein
MPRRRPHAVLQTHLLYGEGPTEIAFLQHLKALFHPRGGGFRITIDGDQGGGPTNVLDECISVCGVSAYEHRVILMDTDLPWHGEEVIAKASAKRIQLLGSEPCIEGLLLRILGQTAPATSDACKRQLREWLPAGTRLTDPRSYARFMPEEILLSAKDQIPTLATIIKFLQTGTAPETTPPDA